MLIEFYGKNFGCFRDEFRLSMVAADIDPGDDRGIVEVAIKGEKKPLRLLRAAAIYGPNASGKSTVLRAAGALGYLIKYSAFAADAPSVFEGGGLLGKALEPFALGKAPGECELGLDAVIGGEIYRYRIVASTAKVLSERLDHLGADGDETLFEREGKEVSGKWRENADSPFSLICNDFREDALLLSIAMQLAPAQARKIGSGLGGAVGHGISWGHGKRSQWRLPAEEIYSDGEFARWTLQQLRAADTGVVNLHAEREEVSVPPLGAKMMKIPQHKLTLHHQGDGGELGLPIGRESDGTISLLKLSPILYQLTRAESPPASYFVDEIHESLHPTLLQAIIRHFNCEVPMAQVRGQLIFATHETALLDSEAKNNILRRDQVYFTKKLADGSATLYSLVEFKERNNLNLRKRYLEGRYGALPNIEPFDDSPRKEVAK